MAARAVRMARGGAPSDHSRRSPPSLDPGPLVALLPDDIVAAAQACGVSTERVRRWRVGEVRINRVDADRIACRLGVHPAYVWRDAWWR